MNPDQARILYTLTDEAPALATYSLLPIIQAFTRAAGVTVETRDISLAARILAVFPERLRAEQRVRDDLRELGALAIRPEANIIKLPNISASLPQLTAAIAELQAQGYALPDYPTSPATAEENEIRTRYDAVKGSAVNPVLREGNSDRRAPAAVKAYARSHPHAMGVWRPDSRSHVAHMESGDFYGSERSITVTRSGSCRIELLGAEGRMTVLKPVVTLTAGDVIDAAVMSRSALRSFLARQIEDAKAKDVLFSIHLKATMMKVSDPILFGHAVQVFFAPVFEKHGALFAQLGVEANNGLADLYARLATLPEAKRKEVEADLQACVKQGPALAMVDSGKGITNLHVPSDVIVDASMPAAIRTSGQMWGPDGRLKDTKFIIPDRCYAGVYQAAIEDCREHGAIDPATAGTVPNVGLMAQQAEEYGSHDKTFQVEAAGLVRIVDEGGKVLLEQPVERGDLFRMCQVKDAPVQDWVKLAVSRARASGMPAVFWLDEARAHDQELIRKVKACLPKHDTAGLDIRIMNPVAATRLSFERLRAGLDTLSVTGNVLRDYLTDLFPILEVGTSAKMLSIVPLMGGGGLFETGAGGSAPKHVTQFLAENHLRWDSLGEFLALAASLEHLAVTFGNERAQLLAWTLDAATATFLEEDKSPGRKAGELDNRGSHFYLALYWARALATQKKDVTLGARFQSMAAALSAQESVILAELAAQHGRPVDIGGYYHPDPKQVKEAMCPSPAFSAALDLLR